MIARMVLIFCTCLSMFLVPSFPKADLSLEIYSNSDRYSNWWERVTEGNSWIGKLLGKGFVFEKSYGVVIAVGDYSGEFDDLASPAKDAIRVRDFLLNEAGFDQVWVLTDEAASRTAIHNLMADVVPSTVGPSDRLLVYWSGHGGSALDARNNPYGFLALSGATLDGQKDNVHMDELSLWLRRIRARHVLFVIDACFSGHSLETKGFRDDPSWDQIALPAQHILTSSSTSQVSYGYSDGSGGLFTTAFLSGARGAADSDRDGISTVTEMALHVETELRRNAAAFSFLQTPQFGSIGHQEGRFFFFSDHQPSVIEPSTDSSSVQGYGALQSLIWSEEDPSPDASATFGDWIAAIQDVDGDRLCYVRSSGVEAINAHIASGNSSLNTLVPYKDGRRGFLVAVLQGAGAYKILYFNRDFENIVPNIATDFNIAVLNLWAYDPVEREYSVRSFGIVDIDVGVDELRRNNIFRVTGYRDPNRPLVRESMDLMIATLKERHGARLTDSVLNFLIGRNFVERVSNNLSLLMGSQAYAGGVNSLTADVDTARSLIIDALISEERIKDARRRSANTDLEKLINSEIYVEEGFDESSSIIELISNITDDDIIIILRLAESLSQHITFIDRISLFGFTDAYNWLKQKC